MTRTPTRRPGSILPLLTVSVIALFGFVALGIDLGMMAIARTQCQNAADAAALAAARTLSGDPVTNNNFVNCEPAARRAVSANKILGTNINGFDAGTVQVQVGAYAYDAATGQFVQRIPKAASDPYSLVRVSITVGGNRTYFGSVFGLSSFATTAVATAAHRPRDVALILDFSGSMRFGSLLGIPYNGTRDNGSGSGSNNPESVYPKFGHYTSTGAGLRYTADSEIGGNQYTPSNVTEADAANDTRPAIVGDFYQNPPYTDPDVPAFNTTATGGPAIPADGSLDADNWAGGDKWLRAGNVASNGYAQTLYDVTGSTSTHSGFEANGYKTFSADSNFTFKGYVRGPRYWGKTFFIWPPDPTNDWRQKFFGTTNNTKLWDSSGNWRTPPDGGYTINYTAILNWIKNTGPNPFPSQLRAGHIQYYTAIPTTIDTSSFPPTNKDQRFWKEYIDHCLGLEQTGSSSWSSINSTAGYGDDFTWGTVQINSPPNGKYMNYKDNPKRPRTHFWFGPMTLVDFLGNYNQSRFWWPGTCHEAPLYACKLAVQAALDDAKNNHPNDFMSLIMFSVPKESSSDSSGRFNSVRVPLGKNYPLMKNSLWFPLPTLNADGTNNNTVITPYDAANADVPRAQGGTCYAMGLMLAYNQFQYTASSDTVLRKWVTPTASVPEGMAGGMGRKGAQKMVIFMTDGAPNTKATATLKTSGSLKYYQVRHNASNVSASEWPSVSSSSDNDSSVLSQIYGVIDQLKAAYSTPRKPFRLHTIGFGPVFDSSNSDQAACLSTLQTMQYRGNTQASAATALDSYKVVTGTDAQVISKLQTAITKIMQGSIQIVLLD